MARNLKYRIPFRDIENVECTIFIYEENYSGSVIKLTAAKKPFEYDEDNTTDTIGVPIRTLTGHIRVLDEGDGKCDALVANSVTQYSVKVVQGSTVVFVGYITPLQMSQDWGPAPREIELPVQSPLAILNSYDYLLAENETATVAEAIYHCLAKVYDYTTFNFRGGEYPLDSLGNCFRNRLYMEFDESENKLKRQSCLVVLEEICKYYNWTLREWGEQVLFDRCKAEHVRSFSRSTMAELAARGTSWRNVTPTTIYPSYVIAATDMFPGFNSNKGRKSLSTGLRNVTKTIKPETSVADFMPDFDSLPLGTATQLDAASGDDGYEDKHLRMQYYSLTGDSKHQSNLFARWESWDSKQTEDTSSAYGYGTRHSHSWTTGLLFTGSGTKTLKLTSNQAVDSGRNVIKISGNVKYLKDLKDGFYGLQNGGLQMYITVKIGNYYYNSGGFWENVLTPGENNKLWLRVGIDSITDNPSSSKILCNQEFTQADAAGNTNGAFCIYTPTYLATRPIGPCTIELAKLNIAGDMVYTFVDNFKIEVSEIEEDEEVVNLHIDDIRYTTDKDISINHEATSLASNTDNYKTKTSLFDGEHPSSYYDAAQILEVNMDTPKEEEKLKTLTYTHNSETVSVQTNINDFSLLPTFSVNNQKYSLISRKYNVADRDYELMFRRLSSTTEDKEDDPDESEASKRWRRNIPASWQYDVYVDSRKVKTVEKDDYEFGQISVIDIDNDSENNIIYKIYTQFLDADGVNNYATGCVVKVFPVGDNADNYSALTATNNDGTWSFSINKNLSYLGIELDNYKSYSIEATLTYTKDGYKSQTRTFTCQFNARKIRGWISNLPNEWGWYATLEGTTVIPTHICTATQSDAPASVRVPYNKLQYLYYHVDANPGIDGVTIQSVTVKTMLEDGRYDTYRSGTATLTGTIAKFHPGFALNEEPSSIPNNYLLQGVITYAYNGATTTKQFTIYTRISTDSNTHSTDTPSPLD